MHAREEPGWDSSVCINNRTGFVLHTTSAFLKRIIRIENKIKFSNKGQVMVISEKQYI